jgi:hypothetical protein
MNGTETLRTRSEESGSPYPALSDAANSPRGVTRRLCIPCAVESSDFKERAPSPTPGFPHEEATVRAWIDGRAFKLFRHPSARIACERCGQQTPAVYAAEDEQAA